MAYKSISARIGQVGRLTGNFLLTRVGRNGRAHKKLAGMQGGASGGAAYQVRNVFSCIRISGEYPLHPHRKAIE